MPSTGTNRVNSENLLRTVYLRKMRAHFSLRSLLLQAFRRNETSYAPGKEISVALHAAGGEGYSWSRAGLVPPPSHQQVERATFKFEQMSAAIRLEVGFVEDAASKEASEVRPLEFETKGLVEQLRKDLNFDMYGNGTGIVATVKSSADNTSFVVDELRGVRNNLRVDVLRTDDGTDGGGGVFGAQITVNRKTNLVTLKDGATLSSSSVLNGNTADFAVYRSNSRNEAIFGLDAAISDANPPGANYGNVDRSLDANDFYRANVLDNNGTKRAPTMKLFQDMLDLIQRNGPGQIDLIIVGLEVWSALIEELTKDRRYGGNQKLLMGWAEAVMFGSIPITKDADAPPDKAWFIDTSTWTIYQNDEGKWMDQDGAILSRVTGRTAYEATFYRRMQPVCHVPIANGVIEDLEYVAA